VNTAANIEILPDEALALAAVPLPCVPNRAQIEALEDAIATCGAPPCGEQTRHYFADGFYAREIKIPAGVILTGKVHRHEHINVISQGRITVWTEDGMKTLEAPCTLVSRAGAKRVGYTHTDTVWTTFHLNGSGRQDPEEMERLLVEPLRPALLAALKQKETPCLSSQ
jgi:hypothetical protein